jgi:GTP-binding protein
MAVIGRSNVGKSSLINAVLERRALARTSQYPGKTQLCNVFAVDERFHLLDLPGYGFARVSQAQRASFRRLLSGIVTGRPLLAGVLWLLDIRHAPSTDDHAMHEILGVSGTPVLLVVTKADKLARGKRAQYVRSILDALQIEETQCVMTSARTREGITELREAIAALLAQPAA